MKNDCPSLSDAYREAQRRDIDVQQVNMKSRTAVIRPDGLLAIDYSRIESEEDEKAILLEEIGHFCTYAFYPQDAPYSVWEKQEIKAARFVFEKYYPPCLIAKQMERGNIEPWQLAEALELPERFVREMLEFYRDVRQVDFTVFSRLPKVPVDEKAVVEELLDELQTEWGIHITVNEGATVKDILDTLRSIRELEEQRDVG